MKTQINCSCGAKLVLITWFPWFWSWDKKLITKFFTRHNKCGVGK